MVDSRPQWLAALRKIAASAVPEDVKDNPPVVPTFGTVTSLSPLRIKLDSDPSTVLPYAPACLDYPTAVGQRVWVQTYGRQVVIVGVAKSSPDIPVGVIHLWPGSEAIPETYLEANGQTVSRDAYAALFGVLGTTYGAGNGSTTFAVPDYRARVAVHPDPSNWSEFATVGQKGGQVWVTLTTDQMPAHTHKSDRHTYQTRESWASDKALLPVMGWNGDAPAIDSGESAGGGQQHPNLQPYIVQRYIIKAK